MAEIAENAENVYQRLLEAQHELKAPRQAGGRFGKARSAEQILEAAKPVCRKYGLLLTTSDYVHYVGTRTYVTATASVINVDKPDEGVRAEANAWEGDISRGLDAPQVTGAASSYAKKYALQNLFAIDDTKDADFDSGSDGSDRNRKTPPKATSPAPEADPLEEKLEELRDAMERYGYEPKIIRARLVLVQTVEEADDALAKIRVLLNKKEAA